MSSGSHSGPLFQSMPTHMGIWDKWILGWADPLILAPGASRARRPDRPDVPHPVGTEDGVRVSLPDKTITLATPHSGTSMWWSNNDQDWADVRLARTVDVPAGAADARFWMWNDYTIEEDWDFGFVEVSTDGGATWAEQKVYDEAGAEVTTPDGYEDPNGRMADFGGKKYGLTGDTGGWQHHYVDLTAFAGKTVQLRLRYATDEAFLERGWFVDDLEYIVDGTTVFADDAEANNGWTHGGRHLHRRPPARAGSSTVAPPPRRTTTWPSGATSTGSTPACSTRTTAPTRPEACTGGAWRVEKVKYNAPGLLVWYRDTSYGNDNHVTSTPARRPERRSKGRSPARRLALRPDAPHRCGSRRVRRRDRRARTTSRPG